MRVGRESWVGLARPCLNLRSVNLVDYILSGVRLELIEDDELLVVMNALGVSQHLARTSDDTVDLARVF